MISHYIHVFMESAHAASIVPMASEASLAAMKAFGGFDLPLAVALSVAGAMLGQCFNWGVGRVLLSLKHKENWAISEVWYGRVQRAFNRYGIFLLLFAFAPLCNFFVVAAGFLKVRLKVVLPLVALGEAVHYGMVLL